MASTKEGSERALNPCAKLFKKIRQLKAPTTIYAIAPPISQIKFRFMDLAASLIALKLERPGRFPLNRS